MQWILFCSIYTNSSSYLTWTELGNKMGKSQGNLTGRDAVNFILFYLY